MQIILTEQEYNDLKNSANINKQKIYAEVQQQYKEFLLELTTLLRDHALQIPQTETEEQLVERVRVLQRKHGVI